MLPAIWFMQMPDWCVNCRWLVRFDDLSNRDLALELHTPTVGLSGQYLHLRCMLVVILIVIAYCSNGTRITLGSDAPVESPDPLVTFHAAVTRVNSTGGSPQGPGGWYPEQKITRKEALKGPHNSHYRLATSKILKS